MTQTEAALLADRMARVWRGKCGELYKSIYGHWMFECGLADGTRLFVLMLNPAVYRLRYQGCQLESQRATGKIHAEALSMAIGTTEEITEKWLPFFQRGLYLSGCATDTTLHEKMQWLHKAKEAGTLREDEVRELLERERMGVAS